ncbi:sulfotransferase 1 family member D1-like [Triplophysa rosa]|uniref:Sulfotransferase n=1 Tax=Triplophysa rosa TaxID=992332 RepID=A0A9W7TGM3_TRIRA|nr:sulfotransferase 1 family member D1-like [Triplophysa rosa]KAI7796962.1 sulfotransferase 1C1 [Triplophysa rosa]
MEGGPASNKEAFKKSEKTVHRLSLIDVQGVPLKSQIVNNLDSILQFCPDPSDLLIATYPKAGTTWVQEIVDLLLNNGDAEACKRAPIINRNPFLDSCLSPPLPSGLDLLKEMKPPRVIKTHMPIQLVPKGFWDNKCKVIYVARNAKDNVVSYFYFDQMNLTHPEPGSWDGYIQKFMKGQLSWGSWYDHVKGYWRERKERNILYLLYEDMKENPGREIKKIRRYLGVSVSDDVIERIVQLTSFKTMKDNPMANYSFIPKLVFDQSVSLFMRKGEVGDWVNHFTPAQSQMFDEDYAKQMKDVDIQFRFRI